MKKLSIIIITLLLLLMTFSACSQVKDSGNSTDVSDDPQTTTQNNETTGPNTPDTSTPDTSTPETNTPETNVPDTPPSETTVPEQKKTVDELAQEVIAGKWGAEPERKTRLIEAGYDYYAVQDKVNALFFTSKYTVGGEYRQALDFNNYFGNIVSYFNKPYKSGDDLSEISLPGMAMTLYFWNRDYFDFVQVDMNNWDPMVVDGSEVRNLIRLTVKDYINLYSYNNQKLNSSTDDAPVYYTCNRVKYSANDDKYYYERMGSDHPAGTTMHGYEKESLQITETDTTITAVAVILKAPDAYSYDYSTARKLEYTFNKVVYNDMLYYQLVEVKTVE